MTFGRIPKDISGVYLRNGPNLNKASKSNRNHLFDGDGMIHAIRFSEDKLHYCNRAIQTPKLRQESEYGRALYIKMGELPSMYTPDTL